MRFTPAILLVLILTSVTTGQFVRGARINLPGNAGSINLPYSVQDNQGNNWMIYQNGMLQMQGNFPMYSQGAMLTVNGQNANNNNNNNNNQARMDNVTGEIVFENMNVGGFTVTRRILVDKETSMVRYIDIVKNNQNAEAKVNLRINSNLNYGVQQAQNVPDPKKAENNIGWVAQTGAGRAVVEVFAGSGSKVVPQINWPQGSNNIMATLQTTVPGGKEIAWMHFHATAMTQDGGVQLINAMNPGKILQSIPREIRKLIINFAGTQSMFGEIELLRGDVLDVVELRGGDQLKGSIKAASFKLSTSYGPVELAAEKVLAMVSVGRFRPRQLIATVDGEVFGGILDAQTLEFELSSGQVTAVPVTQITRLGTRKRAGEPEEFVFNAPLVTLKSGERFAVVAPAAPLPLLTRYGTLSLPPASISSINFQPEDQPVHEITLIDGSTFAGLYASDSIVVRLSNVGKEIDATLPASTLAQLRLGVPPADIDDNTPTLTLSNNDRLVGIVSGDLKLDTAYDTLTVRGEEIQKIVRVEKSPVDVQITLWDQSTLTGQLQEQQITCALKCGAAVKIPVALIQEYLQPQPKPSAMMADKIKEIVAALSSENWKERDRAQAQLLAMGAQVAGVLSEIQSAQPPEAQERINAILAAVRAGGEAPVSPAGTADAVILPD